jgi:hypothetical protein
MANMVRLNDICPAILGITSRRYRQLAEEGHVPKPEKGQVDLMPAIREYIGYLQERLRGSGSLSLTDERTRLTKIQADRKEIELLKARGELIPVQDALKVWGAIVMAMKTKIQAAPRKLAPIVFGCTKETEIQEILERNSDEICSELSEPDLRYIAVNAGLAAGRAEGSPAPAQTKTTAKRQRVGGPKQSAQSGGKRGTRKVVHGKS